MCRLLSPSGSTTQRGYGWHWQKLRETILTRDSYLCIPCRAKGNITPAEEVDHIKGKAQGGSDEPENLQSICKECHAIKTTKENGGTPKVKRLIGADGWPCQ